MQNRIQAFDIPDFLSKIEDDEFRQIVRSCCLLIISEKERA